MIKWLRYNKQFIIATVIFSIFGTGVAFGLPYIPSDAMLDPTCAPGDANCYVSILPTLTTGSIAFSDGSTLTQDNTNFFWDDTNDRLGIGTNTPTYKLEVSGSDVLLNNIRVGLGAGSVATNTAVGYQTLNSNTNGSQNTAVGYQTLYSSVSALQNTAIGYTALYTNTGNGSTAVGYRTLYSNIGGVDNTAVGKQSLENNSSGVSNAAFGVYALRNNTTSSGNTAVGVNALYSNSTTGYNTAVGTNALYNNTGLYNTGIGGNVLYNNSTGNYNIGMGLNALRSNTGGSNNVSLGYDSGYNTGGTGNLDNNIFIGYQAANNATSGAGNNIIIGYDIDLPTASGDNQLSIGNLIFGTSIDGTGTSVSSGNIGIGIASPNVRLDVMTASGDVTIRAGATSGAAQFVMQDVAGTNQTLLDLREGAWPGTVNYRVGGFSQSAASNAGQFYFQNRVNNTGYISFSTTTSGSLTEKIRVINSGNLGIGDTTPASLLTVGNGDLFQVDSSGNIVKINNVTYTWPGSQAGASGYVLTNNGSGTLTWAAASGGVTTIGVIGSSANSNGATISGVTLNLEPASASFGGVVTTGTQTFAGAKTLDSTGAALTLSGSGASAVISSATGFFNTSSTGVLTNGYKIGGVFALRFDTTLLNTVLNQGTFSAVTTGSNNFFAGRAGGVGQYSGQDTTSGGNNVGISGLRLVTEGANNIGIGVSSLNALTTASQNIAIGTSAMNGISTTGSDNIAIGYEAGSGLAGDSDNIVMGYRAMFTSSGNENVAIGSAVLRDGAGADNVVIGYGAARQTTAAINYSTIIGTIAGLNLAADGNTLIGFGAGQSMGDAANNIAIGYAAGNAITTGDKNIVIGYDIDAPSNTTDGQMSIGNLIFGTGIDGTGTTLSTGNVGIGDASPAAKFTVGDGDLFQVNSSGAIAAATGITSSGIYSLTAGTSTDSFVDLTSTGDFLIKDNGTAFVTFRDTGRVGIGTGATAPGEALLIKDADATQTKILIENTSTTGTPDLTLYNANGGSGSNYAKFFINGSSGGYNEMSLGATGQAGFQIGGAVTNFVINTYSGNIVFGTNNGALGVERMRISTGGLVNIGGNTSPTNMFSVGSTSQFQVTSTGAVSTTGASVTLSSSTAELRFTTATMDTGIRSVAGDWYIHRTASTGVTPYSNIGIGNSLNSSATGDRNISIGDNTMLNLSSGQFNVAIGAAAAQPLSSGYSNVAINKDALRNISTSSNNISIGESSGFNITTSGTSGGNVLMGSAAGYSLVGFRNVVIGQEAMASEYLAGAAITTSSDNVYLGYHAAVETIGTDNVGIGNQVFGSQSLTNTTADQSIGIGYKALFTSTSGTGNTSIGYGSGLAATSGDYNILLGWQAGDALTTGSKNIVIGYNIDAPSATTDSQLSIGNLIFGTGIDGTGTTVSTGNIGIGIAAPTGKLEVAQTITSTGALKGIVYTGAVNTNQTASTEIPSLTLTTAGRQWATGAIATQREVLITQPTYSFVGASTITNAATMAIAGAPIKSTNASITNSIGLYIQQGSSVSSATNAYGLYVEVPTGATNNYAAYFGGRVGVSMSPVNDFDVNGNAFIGNTSNGGIGSTRLMIKGQGATSSTKNIHALNSSSSSIAYLDDAGNWTNLGKTTIGSVTLGTHRLTVLEDAADYSSNFLIDCNDFYRFGIVNQAGADTPSAGKWIQFNDGDGGDVGTVSLVTGTLTLTTTSDQRLKQDIVDTGLSLRNLMDIKVRDFSYIREPNVRVHGFVAQELYNAYPDAVIIPSNPDEYWKVSYSQLTPLIVKSIQDLDLKITDLNSLDPAKENSLASRIKIFLSDVGNGIQSIFVDEVYTKKLCIDDVCITKQELQQLLQSQNVTPTPDSTPEPTPTPDPVPNTDTTQENQNIEENTDNSTVETPPIPEIPTQTVNEDPVINTETTTE